MVGLSPAKFRHLGLALRGARAVERLHHGLAGKIRDEQRPIAVFRQIPIVVPERGVGEREHHNHGVDAVRDRGDVMIELELRPRPRLASSPTPARHGRGEDGRP